MSYPMVRLKDVCEKIGSGATPRGGKSVYVRNGVYQIRSQNVRNLEFDYSGLVHISEEAANRLRNVAIHPEDVLLNITGDSVARVCRVPEDVFPARVNQHVAIVRTALDKLDPDFLSYYLASPYMQSFMLQLANGKGASRNALTKEMIGDFEVPCPPMILQRRMVEVLKAYDKLIEKNRKQIKLLEEATQRLYKEWFVDLKFPGRETTPIVDGLPEGWHTGSLLDLADVVRGCSYSSDEIVDGEKTLINLGNLAPFGGFRSGYAKPYSGKSRDDQTVAKGDVIMGLTEQATGLAGYAALLPAVPNDSVISADLLKLVPHAGVPAVFVYAVLRFGRLSEFISPLANGTKIKHLRPESLSRATALLPSKQLASDYAGFVAPFYDQISTCNQQITAACEARDRLLPKLMSGEIEV